MPPTRGRVELQGRDITRLAPHKRVGLGLVRTFQINQLFGDADASADPGAGGGAAASVRRAAGGARWAATRPSRPSASAARAVPPAEHAERPTRELPYGKRRLLEIALAVAQRAARAAARRARGRRARGERADILATVAALPADVSVLLIEHDMDLVFSFATRITVLVNGAVLTEGSPRGIAADPQVKAVYLGETAVAHG